MKSFSLREQKLLRPELRYLISGMIFDTNDMAMVVKVYSICTHSASLRRRPQPKLRRGRKKASWLLFCCLFCSQFELRLIPKKDDSEVKVSNDTHTALRRKPRPLSYPKHQSKIHCGCLAELRGTV